MSTNSHSCGTCGQPAVNGLFGTVHSNTQYPHGLPRHLDRSDHEALPAGRSIPEREER